MTAAQDITAAQPMSADVINAISALKLNGFITTIQTISGGVQTMDTAIPRIVTTLQQDQSVGDVTTLPNSGSLINALLGLLAARHKLVVTPVAAGKYDIRDANNKKI